MSAKYGKRAIVCALLACMTAANSHATPTEVYRCDDGAKAARFTQYPCVGGQVVALKPLAGIIDAPNATELAPSNATRARRGTAHRKSKQPIDHAASRDRKANAFSNHTATNKTDESVAKAAESADATPACLMHREHERLLRMLHGSNRTANSFDSSGSASGACGAGPSGNHPKRATRAGRKARSNKRVS